jgi:hypothetical protein
MSKKHFSWLLIVTLVVAGLVLLVPGKTGRESSFEKRELMPGLAAGVNELAFVRLTAGGGEVIASLERSEGKWRVQEASSYPADWDRLKSLLSDLSQAEVIEEKTSNPEYYSRLGVEDVAMEGAGGIMISFADETGLVAVIAGNQASGRDGQYLRPQNSEKSLLIDRELDLPGERKQWLDRDIIDIADSEVVEVTARHADGEVLSAKKTSADDTDFELQNVPDQGEIKSNWTVNAMAGSLAGLELDDVKPDSEFDWSEATVFTVLTADGLQVNVELLMREESAWIRLAALAYQPAEPDQPAEDQTKDQKEDQAENQVKDEAEDQPQELDNDRAQEINQRVSGWAYRIPQSKYDTMTRRMEDMLKKPETS